jgi:gliding motility-associated-like protein
MQERVLKIDARRMNSLLRLVLLTLFLSSSLVGNAQRIQNPSFEGPAQQDRSPEPWEPCNEFSTPDTQPGSWEVNQAASNGATYLGLVTRGNMGPYANHTEAAQIRLNVALRAGQTFNLSIDLALSSTQGHYVGWDFLSYANPVVLKIWGGVESCSKTELLWQSPAVTHNNWQTYSLGITPENQNIRYLILEADYASQPTYFGNILIDNIVEMLEPEQPIDRCNLETFNVFTPNGDGVNDKFLLKPASNTPKFNLKIYNRWGNKVFETDSVDEAWDGTSNNRECAAGVYFWYAEFLCSEETEVIETKMKGSVTLVK